MPEDRNPKNITRSQRRCTGTRVGGVSVGHFSPKTRGILGGGRDDTGLGELRAVSHILVFEDDMSFLKIGYILMASH